MKNNIIPKEYQLECKGCGKILDIRDINVLCHGWIEDGKIICYNDDNEPINYSYSKQLNDNKIWTKDKKSINLN